MSIKQTILGATAAALVLAGASSAGAVTVVHSYNVGSPNFFLTGGTPTSSSISAVFFDSFTADVDFDSSFVFTIPQNGTGSGGLVTTFSGGTTKVTFTDILINGVSYFGDVVATGSGYSLAVGGIPIVDGVPNVIRVLGHSGATGNFSGNATFTAVPEAGTWAMMVGGFGMIIVAKRRRRTSVSFAA